MNFKRTSDSNKGYPKRLLHKYGKTAPTQTAKVDKDTTMDNKNTPLSGPYTSPSTSETTPKTIVSSISEELSAISSNNSQPPGKPFKQEKRAEPQTVAEFIEAFYAGRAKVLSEPTIRRLKSSPIALEAAVRGDLLRRALAIDESLDKTRRLLVLSTEVDELKALGHLLMQFATDVVVLHPVLQTNGLLVHLFPPYGEERSFEDAWRLLNASEVRQPSNVTSTEELQSAQAAEEATTDVSIGDGATDSPSLGVKASSTIRVAQQLANKARRNALLCSVIWRVLHRKQVPLTEAMRALRNTLFAHGVNEPRLEAELLEALALMPEKEDAKVGLLLEWTTKQQSELVNKYSVGQSRIESLSRRVSDLETEVEKGNERAKALRQQVDSERASKEELGRNIGVMKTHGEADYEELRAASLRTLRDSVQQLEQVSVALGRDVPKVLFARDVLDTIVDSLRAATKKLEDM